jgi:hypothetical protein
LGLLINSFHARTRPNLGLVVDNFIFVSTRFGRLRLVQTTHEVRVDLVPVRAARIRSADLDEMPGRDRLGDGAHDAVLAHAGVLHQSPDRRTAPAALVAPARDRVQEQTRARMDAGDEVPHGY